jgi:arginyl-tRNA synthetase
MNVMNIIEQLQTAFHTYLISTYSLSELPSGSELILNTDPTKQQFGDLASTIALSLSKQLKQQPRLLAQEIADNFTHPTIERSEVAGPGFLNLFLTRAAFNQLAQELWVQGDAFHLMDKYQQKNYNIEFVSANPTGPLHLGHGRGGIIGDVLGNVLRMVGQKATKEFYINDAGAQIVRLGESLYIRCQQQLGIDSSLPEDGYQGDYLIALAQKAVALYGQDLLHKPIPFFSEYAKNELLAHIKHTLLTYGIVFDTWFSERQLHETGAIAQALELLNSKGYLYEQDGALWFKSTLFNDDKDRVVRKKTGELTYVAADIAYVQNKLARGYDKLIFVLGQDHHSYVTRLKGIMQALGHNANDLEVILYQLVTLKESGAVLRMSKRAGRMITLEDVIDTVGTDVARFFYLHRKADAHLEFDIELALQHTQENPVYYLQYAYVRLSSIVEKAEMLNLPALDKDDIHALGVPEQLLIKKMAALKHLLQSVSTTYQTHLLTYYALELATLFHKYYQDHRVIDDKNKELTKARLFLIALLRDTFDRCMRLMGISRPEKM